MEDKAIADMFEWDKNVAFEEEPTYIGTIASTRGERHRVGRITQGVLAVQGTLRGQKGRDVGSQTHI